MLRKLLKHEFVSVGRILLPMYAAVLVLGFLMGFMIHKSLSGFIVTSIIGTLYGVMCAVMVVTTLVFLIQRFYKNLLGNEGYLMLTLPVGIGKHIAGKGITASLYAMLSGIVGFLSVVLMGFSYGIYSYGGIFDFIKVIMNSPGLEYSTSSLVLVIIEIVVVLFLACMETALKIYASISVGHQWSNHRALGSVLAYIGFGIIEGVLAKVFGIPTFDASSFISDSDPLYYAKIGLLIVGAIVACLAAIYWLITWLLLSRRLNLQ